jgi:hypothetical protein
MTVTDAAGNVNREPDGTTVLAGGPITGLQCARLLI